jgi:hypothetical protein
MVEAVLQRGGEVATVQEARPSFDEVFAILVERGRDDEGGAASNADADAEASDRQAT